MSPGPSPYLQPLKERPPKASGRRRLTDDGRRQLQVVPRQDGPLGLQQRPPAGSLQSLSGLVNHTDVENFALKDIRVSEWA